MRFRFEPALRFMTALALAAEFAPPSLGQTGAPGMRPPRSDSTTQRELQRTLERELLFKEMQEAMRRGPSNTQPARQPAFAQINEDFTRIQVVNNALAQTLAAGGELDFKLVAQAASEIKRRAGRLKDNLLLPEPAEGRAKASSEIEPGQLKAALAELDRLVISFVHNPGFQSVKVVDAQWSAKARSDLEEIIELSGRLKRSSEQFYKTAQKSH
jgi:predicted flap endonuclease-1-like 5' DNA nuclease